VGWNLSVLSSPKGGEVRQ